MSPIDFSHPPYEFVTTQEGVEAAAQELSSASMLAVDIEGTGLDPYTTTLLLVQVASPEKAFIFDVRQVDLSPIKPLLEDSSRLKLLHNAKFDYTMLRVLADIDVANMYDTMLAERLLTNGISREISLAAVSAKYLGIQMDKEVRQTFTNPKAAFTPEQLEYATLDVTTLFPIFRKQFAMLRKEGLERIANLEFSLVPAVGEMEIRGSFIDKESWAKNIIGLEKERDRVAKEIQELLRPLYNHTQLGLFGGQADVLNINSQPQVLDAFGRLGVDVPSTGVAVLHRTNHPFAKLLLEYRANEKLISAFGFNFLKKIHPVTGRIHPDYMQLGADSGRFSCSKPNLQQIPKDSAFRSCFIAPPGKKLVTADYSQAELRIMAEVSGDPVFVKAYQEDKDLHTLTASQMFGIPFDQVDKDKRFQAKSINFGLMYGRGAASLAAQLEVSTDEAKKLLDIYFKKYGNVRKWLDKSAKEAVKRGYAVTLGGRKRWFKMPDKGDPNYDRLIGSIERQGKNTPIQGTSADMTKYAIVYIYQALRKEGINAYPIHTVHDEVVVECQDKDAEFVRDVMETEMIRAHEVLLKKVPAKVDASIGDVWEH